MKRPRILVLGALAAVTAVALLAAACGGGDSGSSTPAAGSGGSGGKVFKIGLVTDIGGLDDKSFNHLAFIGIQRPSPQLGVDFKVLESHQESEYVPNLQTLAAAHYDLVIAVGFLMDGAIKKVAKAYPKTNFAIIDDAPTPALANVQGLLFKEQESGYLAGVSGSARVEDAAPSRPSAARRSRRSTTTSPATRREPRPRTRASRP